MRVLMVTGMYPSPGRSTNGVAVARQRKSLGAVGVQVDLLHCRPNGRREWLRALLALRRRVSSGRYDVVHLHYGFTTTLLGLFQSLPIVVTYHGTDINGYPFTTWRDAHRSVVYSAAALVTRQLSRRAAAVIVMTSEMKRRLPRSVQAKTWVEPMGVDTTLYHQIERKKARTELGWGSEPVVLFCDSNRETLKRLDLAEAAVREASRHYPSIRLFIMCDMDPEKVPLVLSAADCLLVTSAREGSPNIVRESLACNLPVVSVPVGDIPELLARDPSSGRIVPRDAVLLGNALTEILSRPRPTNLTRLIENHSLAETACRIAGIYELVLSARRRPPRGLSEAIT